MWKFPRLIAHRGGGSSAPENTIAGLRCALDHGFLGVEVDAMLTKDRLAVLMHDDLLGRTVAGHGSVADTLARDLCVKSAGSWFGPQFAQERVPLLVDAIAFCQQHSLWMNVEIKPAPGFEHETGRVVARCVADSLSSWGRTPHPLLSSFSQKACLSAYESTPEVARALLFDNLPEDWLYHASRLDVVAIHLNQKHLNLNQVHEIKKAHFGLFCYTVNGFDKLAELRLWGVDAFCTDNLDFLSQVDFGE